MIVDVLAAHAVAEMCVNTLLPIEGRNSGLYQASFPSRVDNFVDDREWRQWLHALNAARNACAHRSTNFGREEVRKVLGACMFIVTRIERRYASPPPNGNMSRFFAAMNVFLGDFIDKAKIDKLVLLDELYLPGEKSLGEQILELFGPVSPPTA